MNQRIPKTEVTQQEYESATRCAWKPITEALTGMDIESVRLVREVTTNLPGQPKLDLLSALTLQILPAEKRSITSRARLNENAKCLLNAGTLVCFAFDTKTNLDEIEIRGLKKRFKKEEDPHAYKNTLAEIVAIAIGQATNLWSREECKQQSLLITFQIDEVTDEFAMANWAFSELAQMPDHKVLLEFADTNTFVSTGAVRYRTVRLQGD